MVRLWSSVLMTRVFVYGTLKKGQPNNYRMFDSNNGKAEYLGSAFTSQKYPLVITTEDNIPFLLNIPGQGHRVHGEIYKVDDQMLKFLDDFESVPTLYQRTVVQLEVKEAPNRLGPPLFVKHSCINLYNRYMERLPLLSPSLSCCYFNHETDQ
uniref:Gamma-glutamylaminecyclotransferase n=1 Tax=Pundamilia nyererei TaxID=303518 RepID=A0A3B4G4K8_9CICH